MDKSNRDTVLRLAAFEHVRRLREVHDHLTATELKPGFVSGGERFPLINPQRGIFKPQQMRFLLSIRTVFPKPGGKIWYDDQREVQRQIFRSDETVEYAFMGQDRMRLITDGSARRSRTKCRLSTSSALRPAATRRCCRLSFPDGMPRR